MLKNRTELSTSPSKYKINHRDAICLIGSCFSDEIGDLMTFHKFGVLANPFGTLYHPSAILQNIQCSIERPDHVEADLIVQRDERYAHYHLHSDIMEKSPSLLIDAIRHNRQITRDYLGSIDWIIITLGTAHQYHHNELNISVANCHKQPDALFDRQLSSYEQLVYQLNQIVTILAHHRPHARTILTVSPVRHLRDGLSTNSRSKSLLISAAHETADRHESVEYFPAYELMIDDLRGYRYYKGDLIHPNEQAVSYIWQHFSDRYFDIQTIELNTQIRKVQKALSHRPLDKDSESYKAHMRRTTAHADVLRDQFGIDFSVELSPT